VEHPDLAVNSRRFADGAVPAAPQQVPVPEPDARATWPGI
jgi:hypothetical protein